MHISPFNANAWQRQCQSIYNVCGKRAQTPMHHLFLFSQCMDEVLGELDPSHLAWGVEIAQGFGYESPEERHAYVGWFTQHLNETALNA